MVLLVGAGGGGWTPAKIPWAIGVMLLSLGLTTSIWLLLRSARKYLLTVGSGSNQLISNETSGFAPARIAVVRVNTSSLFGASWVKAGTATANMAMAPIAIPATCLFFGRNVRPDLLIISLPLCSPRTTPHALRLGPKRG